MGWIDFVIVGGVALIVGFLVWWRFIKHKNQACSFCEQAPSKKGSRLLKAYRKKYKNSNKCNDR